MSNVDVEAVLGKLAAASKEKLDWRKSIVDLMKLLNLDSSFGARKELAKELGYTGDPNDSASMNIWLHKQVMQKLAAKNKEKLDWKRSIVDLMKLLGLDSSLTARKQLATELGYKGDMNDSATMNIWLHKQVMAKLAANGGKVPAELQH